MTVHLRVVTDAASHRDEHRADMTLLGIDHVAYVVTDMQSAVSFYERVLGLHEVGATPNRDFVAMSWGANVHDIALMQGTPGTR
jgi:catechol-2,3-dioxygenase